MGLVGERIRPAVEKKVHHGLQTVEDKVVESTKNGGRRTGEAIGKGIVHVVFPTAYNNPRSRVESIEGKHTRRTARFFQASSNVLEGSGATLLAAGGVLLNAPIALTGLGIYAAGRVPGVISDIVTSTKLKLEGRKYRKKLKKGK